MKRVTIVTVTHAVVPAEWQAEDSHKWWEPISSTWRRLVTPSLQMDTKVYWKQTEERDV